MNPSPLISVIEFLRLTLLGGEDIVNSQTPIPGPEIVPLPPQYQPPPNLFPNGQDTFLPPLNPGGISVLPPFNPIGPYNPDMPGAGQNPNEVPQDISDLLGGR